MSLVWKVFIKEIQLKTVHLWNDSILPLKKTHSFQTLQNRKVMRHKKRGILYERRRGLHVSSIPCYNGTHRQR